MKQINIDISKLKKILEDPEEPVTPRFILNVVDRLIGLKQDGGLEMDYVWLMFESKYNINIVRKDALSASIAFYNNPVEFFSNPNVFDKMSIAFNGHNVVVSIINEPTPEEATFAVKEARSIISEIWHNKYGSQYPLFPDVAKYVALIYHHNGLCLFHPELKQYQEMLSGLDQNSSIKEARRVISKIYDEYRDSPDAIISKIMDNVKITNDNNDGYIKSNISHLFAIDIYCETLTKYTDSLLFKIKKE